MGDEGNGKIPFLGHPPAIRIVRTQTQRIGCPYCPADPKTGMPTGYVDVTAEVTPGPSGHPQMQIQNFHTPKKCVTCGRFFQLEPVLQVRGVPIPGE